MKTFFRVLLGAALISNLAAFADPAATGDVVGRDSYASGCYLVHLPSDAKPVMGDVVRIERNGTLISEGRVAQIQGDAVSIRIKDTKAVVQTGDTVVYVGAPPPPPNGNNGVYVPKPKVQQPGFHLTVNAPTTYTDDNGQWAANCLVSNDGDEGAWIHLGASITASTGDKQDFIDQWHDLAPGETWEAVFTSRFKSPFGRNNDVTNNNGMKSNWSVSSRVNDITSISCELHPKSGTKGKPRQ